MAKISINDFSLEFNLVGSNDDSFDYEVYINNIVIPTTKEIEIFSEDINAIEKFLLKNMDSCKIPIGINLSGCSYGEIIFSLDKEDVKIESNAYICLEEYKTNNDYALNSSTFFVTNDDLYKFYNDLKKEFLTK